MTESKTAYEKRIKDAEQRGSLLDAITSKDKVKEDDLMARAKRGEIIRIM